MKHTKALVSLTLGEQYIALFKRYCEPNWRAYAEQHGYDLVIFDQPLDTSPRAASRSPSWQKCLILEQPELQQYEQIVWVDSDIIINPTAPCICEHVPQTHIGAVETFSLPSRELNRLCLQRLYDYLDQQNVTYLKEWDSNALYANFGLPTDYADVVQAGLMVMSPQHHQTAMRKTYDHYEDKGATSWNYEMRPLSYELLKHYPITWLNPRFNTIWIYEKLLHYPFLMTGDWPATPSRWSKSAQRQHQRFQQCLQAACDNAYFMHFAGTQVDMAFLP